MHSSIPSPWGPAKKVVMVVMGVSRHCCERASVVVVVDRFVVTGYRGDPPAMWYCLFVLVGSLVWVANI